MNPSGPASNGTTSGVSSPAVAHTISGFVTDSISGAGIDGASVEFARYSATTNADGSFSITVDAGVPSVTGDLTVFEGTSYSFIYVQAVTMDTSADVAGIRIPLIPKWTTWTSNQITVQGRVYDQSGSEAPSNSFVTLYVVNASGGFYRTFFNYTNGTPYSVTLPAMGPDCTIVVAALNTGFYLSHQDLTTDATIDLKVPPASDYTMVTVNGAPSNNVALLLDLPSYGGVPYAYDNPSSSSGTFSGAVYDPENYRLQWVTVQEASTSTFGWYSYTGTSPSDRTSSVTAPTGSFTTPTSATDPANVTYTNGTLSLPSLSGANLRYLRLDPGASSAAGSAISGFLYLSGNQATLPGDLVNRVLMPVGDWDLSVEVDGMVSFAHSVVLAEQGEEQPVPINGPIFFPTTSFEERLVGQNPPGSQSDLIRY